MMGIYFVASAIFLTVAVAGVYSVAQEPFAPAGRLWRQSLRRSAKLGGALVVIMVVVFFLSRV
jgi:hypothetical protein